MSNWLDATDGVFINVGGTTGELVHDPNTGELKVVVGSNQPVGGGPGGTTQAGSAGQPGAGITTAAITSLLSNAPTWAFPVTILVILFLWVLGASRK